MPIMTAVLVGFVVIGAALPVLPLHVRHTLGFGPFVVGIVAGCQFAAALVGRLWTGYAADTKGAKWAVMVGLTGAGAAGLLYLLSLAFVTKPMVSLAILLAGRAVLGGAESFIITGAMTWGLVRVGNQHAGKVIAWMGMAMFAAFAAGAPLGTILYDFGGFGAVALATEQAVETANAGLKAKSREANRAAKRAGLRIAELEDQVARASGGGGEGGNSGDACRGTNTRTPRTAAGL